MRKLKKGQLRRLAKAKPDSNKNATRQWAESFTDYLRSECHLAENTVLAYTRDMRRFLDWLGDRGTVMLNSKAMNYTTCLPTLANRST